MSSPEDPTDVDDDPDAQVLETAEHQERYQRLLDQLAVELSKTSMADVVRAEATIAHHAAADRPDLIDLAVEVLGDDAYVEDYLAWVVAEIEAEQRTTNSSTARPIEEG